MKIRYVICVIVLIITLLTACTEEKPQNVAGVNTTKPDVNQAKENDELNMYSIFPEREGTYWYYEGPLDTELILVLDSVKAQNNSKAIKLKAINEDLSGELSMDERIFFPEIIISEETIIRDGVTILKAPLTVGNTWSTDYYFNLNRWNGREKSDKSASVTITSVEGNIITTETIIPDLSDYADKKYIERTVFEVGKGITSQWNNYSHAKFEDFSMGFNLKTILDKQPDPQKWYLPPYAVDYLNKSISSDNNLVVTGDIKTVIDVYSDSDSKDESTIENVIAGTKSNLDEEEFTFTFNDFKIDSDTDLDDIYNQLGSGTADESNNGGYIGEHDGTHYASMGYPKDKPVFEIITYGSSKFADDGIAYLDITISGTGEVKVKDSFQKVISAYGDPDLLVKEDGKIIRCEYFSTKYKNTSLEFIFSDEVVDSINLNYVKENE